MEVFLNQVKDFKFEFNSSNGFKTMLDGPQSIGGRDDGFRPMEMILGGLAGCSSFDILSILKKSKQPIENFRVEVKAKRRDEIPKIFTDVHLLYIIRGNVDEKHLKRAIDLSIDKYCSVSKMLETKVNITTQYRFEN